MQPSSSLLSQYQTFQTNRTKPEDYVKKYSTDLGVDDARARVKSARAAIKSTEDTIAGAPASVAGRTSGSLVNDSQRNRLVQNEVAPLQEIMRTQSSAYGDASNDLNTLGSELDKRVGYGLQTDDTQANTLLQLYSAASDQEKTQEAKRQFDENLALQREQVANTKAAMASPSIGASGTRATPPAVMTQKSNGSGFAFADNTGQSISAAKFAQLTGQDIRSVLYTMGQQGDSYAAAVYNQLRQDPFFGKGDANYDKRVKNAYSPLFWGV